MTMKKFYLCKADPSVQGYISSLRATGRFRDITYNTTNNEPLVYCEAPITNDGHEAWNALGIFKQKLSDYFNAEDFNGDNFIALNSMVIDRLFGQDRKEMSIDEYIDYRKRVTENEPDHSGIFEQIFTDLWEEEGHL